MFILECDLCHRGMEESQKFGDPVIPEVEKAGNGIRLFQRNSHSLFLRTGSRTRMPESDLDLCS
jgi:hypothetical protein